MRCIDYLEQLDEYVDGQLDKTKHFFMAEHEASCANCHQTTIETRMLLASLAELGQQEPPKNLHTKMMQAVKAQTKQDAPSRKMGWRGMTSIAAAVLLIVAIPFSQSLLPEQSYAQDQQYASMPQASTMPETMSFMADDALSKKSTYGGSADLGGGAEVGGGSTQGSALYDTPMQENAYAMEESPSTGGLITDATSDEVAAQGQKFIRSGNISLESRTFDIDVLALEQKITEFDGYLQSSSQSGSSYQASPYDNQRSINLSVRIPDQSLDLFVEQVKTIGNVLNASVYSYDISANYQDTELRLATLRAQHARLSEMMNATTMVEDLVKIEAELSRVLYEIDSMTSTLRAWDNQVSYATIDIYITEVNANTWVSPEKLPLTTRIADAFVKGIRSIITSSQNLLLFLITAFPYLVIVGIVAWIVVLTIKRYRNKKFAPPTHEDDPPQFD